MTVAPARHRFTVDDFHRMGKAGMFLGQRVELIEGEILDMSPIGRRHNATVDFLNRAFVRMLDDKVIVRTQGSVRLSDISEPQPDLVLLRPRADFYSGRDAAPCDVLLVVEVSDTTLLYDRNRKAALYARAGIPECWIIHLSGRRVLVFRQPGPRGYRERFEVASGGVISPITFPGLLLSVDEILCEPLEPADVP
jgi:Uma2 family endonuclease